jgi:hypothetical protein
MAELVAELTTPPSITTGRRTDASATTRTPPSARPGSPKGQVTAADSSEPEPGADVDAAGGRTSPVTAAGPGEAEHGFRHPGFGWLDRAACADMSQEQFFVNAGHVMDDPARHACLTCPVWRECTIFSYLGSPEGKLIAGGYFAGLSLGQRRKMSLGQALAVGEANRKNAVSNQAQPLMACPPGVVDTGDDLPHS